VTFSSSHSSINIFAGVDWRRATIDGVIDVHDWALMLKANTGRYTNIRTAHTKSEIMTSSTNTSAPPARDFSA
jgi:hypothetical protein